MWSKEFVKYMNEVLKESDASKVPGKYLNQEKNYTRHATVMKAIKRRGLKKGLDFGCGLGSCCVLGKMQGLDIAGVDVPTYGMKRNKKTKVLERFPEIESRYLSVQKRLVELGHNIHIFDTTVFPWTQFADNEFEFITFLWSINKQFINKDWDLEDRIKELVRITKDNGVWFIRPARHTNLISTRFADLVRGIQIQSV